MTNIVVGSVVGTGAALNVQCGFVPSHVRVVNATDGTDIDEWFQGMAAGTSIRNNSAAVALRANPDGITPYAGAVNAACGFTIGVAMSVNGKTLRYVAFEEGPGWQG